MNKTTDATRRFRDVRLPAGTPWSSHQKPPEKVRSEEPFWSGLFGFWLRDV
jgi:hypothetical protein